MKSGLACLFFCLAAMVMVQGAMANSAQIVIYNNRYPTTAGQTNQGSNCAVCHSAVPTLNPFGLAFKNSPAGPDSTNGLAQIEFVDSDGDNFSNLHEILLFNLPGASGNKPANANTAPVLNAIGNKTLNEGQTLNFQVTTTDDVNGLSPLLSVTNLPPGATFTDNRDRTGTFSWATDFADGGVYNNIQFTSSDGLLTDTETITITVADIDEAPEVDPIENQVGYAGSLLEFDVFAADPENSPITLSAQGLPDGAFFADNGDGSGTLSWLPGTADIGVYTGVTFIAEDGSAQTGSAEAVIFITAPPQLFFSGETPLNTSAVDDEVLDYRADLATDGSGNWVAVWYISDTGIVTCARSSDNGHTWSTPAAVSPLDGADEAPQIATDRAGNWVVVWRSDNSLGDTIGNDLDILVSRSTDNGQTWTPAAALNTDAATDGSESDRGANVETDGSVWVATWMKGTSVYSARSTDDGQTWTAPGFRGTGLVESFPDTTAPRLAADTEGNWMIVWSDGAPFNPSNDVDVQVVRSADGGQTWTTQADLAPNAGSDDGDDHLPSIASDGGDLWITVWRSTDTLGGTIGTDSDILISRSFNDGETWSTPEALALDAPYDRFLWDYAPSITTDRRGVWVTMWHTDGSLIRMSYSANEGSTWSFPEVLNELHNDTTRLPQAFTDRDGSWLAVWETNENPNDSGFDIDLMIAGAFAPEVDSILPVGNTLTNADQVQFSVTFDSDVSGVNSGDFAVAATGEISGADIFSVSAVSATEYTVTVTTGTGSGGLTIDFVDDGTVFGATGNAPGGPGAGNGGTQGDAFFTIDKTPPVITRNGSVVVTIEVGDAYTDAGATALDDIDGDISGQIETTDNVDTSVPGIYSVLYNVTDEAGNSANQVARTVNVVAPPEGEGAQDGEGSADGEGATDGEGNPEGEGAGDGEGTADGEGTPAEEHSADQNGDEVIVLTELLRLVQLYSLINYGCDANAEDGYSALSADQTCTPHASDYDPQDWAITLNELVRLIQFYNAGGYEPCISEDGFCPAQ